jgi:hypothetical protein
MYYLGLDVSTTCVGIAITDDKENIHISEALKLDTSYPLEDRAANLQDRIRNIMLEYPDIDKVYIESPIVLFKGGSSALTVAILQRFNGMVCFAMYQLFNENSPILLNVISARAKLGIKIPRGKKSKHEKKQPIIDFIENKYKDTVTPFLYEITNKGNFKPTVDDRADALVLCLAGPKMS